MSNFHIVSLFFDVKDIILNVCGIIVGIIIFEVIVNIVRKKSCPKCGNQANH